MLEKLHQFAIKTNLLSSKISDWESLYIDYHKPYVERLYKQLGNERYYLHRIYPCKQVEALFHPHPWPSAVKVISGKYEMGIGYNQTNETPNIAATVILSAESSYEMLDEHTWHYVRPLNECSYSIMITGDPFYINSNKQYPELKKLDDNIKTEILENFKDYYSKFF